MSKINKNSNRFEQEDEIEQIEQKKEKFTITGQEIDQLMQVDYDFDNLEMTYSNLFEEINTSGQYNFDSEIWEFLPEISKAADIEKIIIIVKELEKTRDKIDQQIIETIKFLEGEDKEESLIKIKFGLKLQTEILSKIEKYQHEINKIKEEKNKKSEKKMAIEEELVKRQQELLKNKKELKEILSQAEISTQGIAGFLKKITKKDKNEQSIINSVPELIAMLESIDLSDYQSYKKITDRVSDLKIELSTVSKNLSKLMEIIINIKKLYEELSRVDKELDSLDENKGNKQDEILLSCSDYLTKAQEDKSKKEKAIKEIREKVKLRKDILEFYIDMGVSVDQEKVFESEISSDAPKSVIRGEKLSFVNIRETLRLFFENACTLVTFNDCKKELLDQIKENKDKLDISCNQSSIDAIKILQTKEFKNIFDLLSTIKNKAKRMRMYKERDPWGGYFTRRKETEQELGWPSEQVYYLAVDSPLDEQNGNGSAKDWGSVRFVFDFDSLAKYSTFTEGDSMNLRLGVPSFMFRAKENEPVTRRQISKKHLLISKSLFDIAKKKSLISSSVGGGLRCYIEAQVGTQPFGFIKEIVIDQKELIKEMRHLEQPDLQKQLEELAKKLNIPIRYI